MTRSRSASLFPGILAKFPVLCFPIAARTWDFKSFSDLHIVILKLKLNRDQTFKMARTNKIEKKFKVLYVIGPDGLVNPGFINF